jgi:hypothetical protein
MSACNDLTSNPDWPLKGYERWFTPALYGKGWFHPGHDMAIGLIARARADVQGWGSADADFVVRDLTSAKVTWNW